MECEHLVLIKRDYDKDHFSYEYQCLKCDVSFYFYHEEI